MTRIIDLNSAPGVLAAKDLMSVKPTTDGYGIDLRVRLLDRKIAHRARTLRPSTSTISSEPTIANGISPRSSAFSSTVSSSSSSMSYGKLYLNHLSVRGRKCLCPIVVHVHGNSVVLNVLHDQFLALRQLERSQGVGLADDGNDIDARREAAHEFDVELTETMACTIQSTNTG